MSKHKSITVNSIWYLIYQVFNVLFPFIATMYAARILLPAASGRVISAQNIAQYFAIFAFLGIPTYGRREISKVRNDKDELSRLHAELFIINSVSTLLFCLSYLALILLVPSYRTDLPLYLVTGGSIALNFFNNSWLFEGLEEFKFISIRNILFKMAALVLMVMFVKDPGDYLMFAVIMVTGNVGNYILNIFYTPKIVKFKISGLNFKRHMGPIFALVTVNLAIELYSLVDVTMIKALVGEENVSYYYYAQGINKILQQVLNTFTIVIVPRLALYYKEGSVKEFNSLISRTFNTIMVLALPMILGVQVIAEPAIVALYGDSFIPSVAVLRIIIVLLIISPVGYLLGSRVLLVTGHENQMALCVWTGAIVNIIGNFILIPVFAERGAAVASVISEICVASVYIVLGRKYFKLTIEGSEILKILLAAALMTVVSYFCGRLTDILILRLVIQVVSGALVYGIVLKLTSEKLLSEYFVRFTGKILHK